MSLNTYCRFIAGFSTGVNPLFALTRKGVPLVWNPEMPRSLEKLKTNLTEAFPNFCRDSVLETDASGAGLGSEDGHAL